MFILEHVVRKRLDLTQAEFSLDRFKIITLKLQRGEEGKEARDTCKHHNSAQNSPKTSLRSIISAHGGSAHFSPLAVMTGSNLCRSHVNYM